MCVCVSGRKANTRSGSHGWKSLERAMGIEPTYEAWEASILPLNYARTDALVRGGSLVDFARFCQVSKPEQT